MRRRRPRPSYKSLYLGLLETLGKSTGDDEYQKMSDNEPTHRVIIEDTVEWVFDIRTDDESKAENFTSFDDAGEGTGVELIGCKKSSYMNDSSVVKLKKE